MTHGQLFGGIFGFGLAAQWAGIENVWYNEIDHFCCEVVKAKIKDGQIKDKVKIYEQDIREIGKHNLQRVDIVSGGFPCQPFSQAGKRKGKSDDRYFWPEMLRVIKELKPPYVIGENVAGLLSMENDTPFEKWLFIGMESKIYFRRIYCRYIYRKRQTYVLNEIIESIEKEGYTVETYLIPACSVGAWHRRNRIWIIAYSQNNGCRGRENKQLSIRERELFQGKQRRSQVGGETERCNRKPKDVPNPKSPKRKQSGNTWPGRSGFANSCKDVSNTDGTRFKRQGKFTKPTAKERISNSCNYGGERQWSTEPAVGRVAHGIPNRVDRLKALGNAIVPQVAYELFKAIKLINDRTKL